MWCVVRSVARCVFNVVAFDVYRGSLQTKNIIIWKITMSILHAIGARWWPTNRGDALQCPNRLKHAADHVAFELPRSSLHGEPHPCLLISLTGGIQMRK